MPLPPDGTTVTAMTHASVEYDRPAILVRGKLTTRAVPALKYTQCWVAGVQVDADSVQAVEGATESTEVREVEFHRGGKTFTEMRKVKVDGGHKSVKKLAAKQEDRVAKDYLEAAVENSDGTAEDIAQQLASMYSAAHDRGHETALGPLHEALLHVGADLEGPKVGEPTRYSGKLYESQEGIGPGDDVVVALRPVVLDGKVLSKGKVKLAGAEETQLVTVHRGGKTFQQHRKKAEHDVSEVPKSLHGKAKAVAGSVMQKARELAVKLTPAAQRIGSLLSVVLDTPEDMKKFAYNPTVSGGKAANNDFVASNLHDAFGVGVSGHIVASAVAFALSHAVVWAKKRLTGAEAADPGIMEFAEFLEALYAHAIAECGGKGGPKAADIAEALVGWLSS